MYRNCVWQADGTFSCLNVKKKLRNNNIVIPKRNLKSIYPSVRRIIAIGDIHGDLQKVKYIFIKAKLIKKNIKGNWMWIGKDTYVVQVGDQVDFGGRGVATSDNSKELEVLLFMDLMDKKARQHKGRVISLLGNHELMNVLGDFRYVSLKGINDFGGEQRRKKLFSPNGSLAKYLAYNRLSIVQIGKWVFVHGGLLPQWIESQDIKKLNNKVKSFLLGKSSLQDDTILQRIIQGDDSFFWTREYGFPTGTNHCNKLSETLKKMNATGMVIGHSIQNSISSDCSNKLWKVDVGMSRAFGNKGRPQCLEIISKKNGARQSIKIIK